MARALELREGCDSDCHICTQPRRLALHQIPREVVHHSDACAKSQRLALLGATPSGAPGTTQPWFGTLERTDAWEDYRYGA